MTTPPLAVKEGNTTTPHCQYCANGNTRSKDGYHLLEIIQGYPAHEVYCFALRPTYPNTGGLTEIELRRAITKRLADTPGAHCTGAALEAILKLLAEKGEK